MRGDEWSDRQSQWAAFAIDDVFSQMNFEASVNYISSALKSAHEKVRFNSDGGFGDQNRDQDGDDEGNDWV